MVHITNYPDRDNWKSDKSRHSISPSLLEERVTNSSLNEVSWGVLNSLCHLWVVIIQMAFNCTFFHWCLPWKIKNLSAWRFPNFLWPYYSPILCPALVWPDNVSYNYSLKWWHELLTPSLLKSLSFRVRNDDFDPTPSLLFARCHPFCCFFLWKSSLIWMFGLYVFWVVQNMKRG